MNKSIHSPITPTLFCESLGKELGVNQLYLKREDLHPYGSYKGRSIPLMIDYYQKQGEKNFVISSSGNAALTAVLHIQSINKNQPKEEQLFLDVLIGKRIGLEKEKELRKLIQDNGQITLTKLERPLKALRQAINEGKRGLRQSTDDFALRGYSSLAKELMSITNLKAVFIATSSGTTAEALGEVLSKKGIQLHIVQTIDCHPIAGEFDSVDSEANLRLADAIVDQVALRKIKVIELVRRNGGGGWIASNEDIKKAMMLVEKKEGIKLTPNGALSLAGLLRARKKGWKWNGAVAYIAGGA